MTKQRFLSLMAKWPKIQFTEVNITLGGDGANPRTELYVRDRADPPCWLFIRRLSADEQGEQVLACYRRWLMEYQHRQNNAFCLPLLSAPRQQRAGTSQIFPDSLSARTLLSRR